MSTIPTQRDTDITVWQLLLKSFLFKCISKQVHVVKEFHAVSASFLVNSSLKYINLLSSCFTQKKDAVSTNFFFVLESYGRISGAYDSSGIE